jgi:hypothetical protein
MSIISILVAGLAIGSVQALPWSWDEPSIKLPSPTPIAAPILGAEPPTSPSPAPSASAPAPSAPAPSAPAPAPAAPNNTDLFRDLFSAPTSIKRFQRLLTTGGEAPELLSVDELKPFVTFDFNGGKPIGKGGITKSANIDSFPILIGQDISTTVGFLGACGMNAPHVHPRAAEFLTVVEGAIKFGYILENGFVAAGKPAEVSGSLSKFQGTVFPMGSIHYQINEDCAPANFVATLNSVDPGTSTIAPNFFALNKEVVSATLGFPESLDGKDIETFRKSIPANIALSIDACLKKCGIDPNAAPK